MKEKCSSKKLLGEFCRLYQKYTGYPYPVRPIVHSSILKSLMKEYDLRVVRLFFKFHLESNEPFVKNAGHSLEILKSQIPRYITMLSKTNGSSDDFERITQC